MKRSHIVDPIEFLKENSDLKNQEDSEVKFNPDALVFTVLNKKENYVATVDITNQDFESGRYSVS